MDEQTEEWLANPETMGVTRVREELNRAEMLWPEDLKRFAYGWLSKKDHERQRRNEASSAEQIAITRSAKNAAWAAAIAAIIAVIVASASVVMSFLAWSRFHL